MNVAIATGRENDGTTEGQSSGISFAIPIGTVESVVPQLIANGRVARGYLGISYDRYTLAPLDDGPYAVGVRVNDVIDDYPGDLAGLKTDDVITEINGQRITSTDILSSVIATTAPGQAIEMRVWRAGVIEDLKVVLTEFPQRDLVRQSLGEYGLVLESQDGDVVMRSTLRFGGTARRDGFRHGMGLVQDRGSPRRLPRRGA